MKKTMDAKTHLGWRVDPKLKLRLREYCRVRGIKMQYLLTKIVHDFLERMEQK